MSAPRRAALGPLVFGVLLGGIALAGGALAQDGLGPGPGWRGPRRPTAHNEVFATGDGCAMCHSASARSVALRDANGVDVSPHALWSASVMANSFRDPYWRAQVAKEIAADPEHAVELQALCLRCHAPMVHHGRRLAGQGPLSVAAAAADPLAQDGVSCTVCHQIQPDGLGTEATFAGRPEIQRGRRIFGPYQEPFGMPMLNFSTYQPSHGAHVQSAALCASCHTLPTEHAGKRFPEQTPYLEWRNSVFSDEAGRTDTSRTCQECHMPDVGAMRLARNPAGRDFNLAPREHVRAHSFVGGNAFLLDLLAANRESLGVPASVEALQQQAMASRRLLAHDTVALTLGPITRSAGVLEFAVQLENRTGHKFPTGYPARRAWLHVQVRLGDQVLFDSGGFTREGAIADLDVPQGEPHRDRITAKSEVAIFELVAADAHDAPTTHLARMHHRLKDNRLLPRGWRADGPHADDTAPVGTAGDADFGPGGDTVHYAVPWPADRGAATVVVWLLYQTIPPHWVAPLRAVDAEECRSFVRMYDAADRTPETVAVAVRSEAR
ncbi:MAG: hypothetical protein JNK49_00045 [Planctomycetes bacterium]|nr:hypothetical protein [Planctomycetota bacterium]